ncbi:MAG: ABC transporter permease [Bacteroidota bacterium]
MNFRENISEAFRSIYGNTLRTVLTALIIAIGIMALVGILTAIDGIQASADSSLADLGANTFDVRQKGKSVKRKRRGVKETRYSDISYQEAMMYKERFAYGSAKVSVSTWIIWDAEVKAGSRKTNPNSGVIGTDENYLAVKSYNLKSGRAMSSSELLHGAFVTIIGQEIADKLFPGTDPLGKTIIVSGARFMVVGVIEATGGTMGGNGSDRNVLIPMIRGKQLSSEKQLYYDVTTIVYNPMELDPAISEASGLMRQVRHDRLGAPDSFEITKAESLAESMGKVTGVLRIGGFVIGLITLAGAAIGLMNIMMVSVTERTREIGIRKALGATPARIRQQFLIEAITITQIGGFFGVLLGIGIGNLVSSGMGINHFIIPWAWMFLGMAMCAAVGIISGFYPAFKASKLDPIESLRFE